MVTKAALSTQHWTLIVAALEAVSPSGGGSDTYTLARLIRAEKKVDPTDEQVIALMKVAVNEYLELGD